MSKKIKPSVVWHDKATASISGVLDEFFDYTALWQPAEDHKLPSLHIDLGGITRINSCGVREWIRHIQQSSAHIYLTNCPPAFIDQVSMIPHFLGSNTHIKSFYGMFECTECGLDTPKLYDVGTTIAAGLDRYEDPEDLICSNCGSHQAFAHDAGVYFSFLVGKLKKAI